MIILHIELCIAMCKFYWVVFFHFEQLQANSHFLSSIAFGVDLFFRYRFRRSCLWLSNERWLKRHKFVVVLFLSSALRAFPAACTHTHTFRFSHLCVVFFSAVSGSARALAFVNLSFSFFFLFPGLPHLFSHLGCAHQLDGSSYEYFAILEQVSRFLSPISSSRLSPGSSSHKANNFLSDYEF